MDLNHQQISLKTSHGPQNTYLRVLGRGFNSRDEDEGTIRGASWNRDRREEKDKRMNAKN